MNDAPTHLQPAPARSLERWHAMIEAEDLSGLPELLHPDAVFRSPMAYTAYAPAAALLLILRTVITIFQDFKYHRQFASDDGLNVVLEFSARVDDKQLKGIDMIRFDDQGRIVEFEVMVRPMSGLQALGNAMAARLAQTIPAFKQKT